MQNFTLFPNFASSCLENDTFFFISRIRVSHWKKCPFFAKMGTSKIYALLRSGDGIMLFCLICAWTKGWANNRDAIAVLIVRRAGLLLSQQDFEWRWSVPLFQCLTVLEFSFILFDLCLLITFFNFIMNYVPIVTFWIFTYHKIWILSIMFCFIWSYWIIYFLACL